MPQYDGSININTKIDTKNVSSQMLRLDNQIAKTARKASELTDELRRMEKQKVPTQEFVAVQKQIDEAQSKLEKLNERMEKFTAIGGNTRSNTFKGMQYDAEQLRKTIAYAKGEMDAMKADNTAYVVSPVNTSAYQSKSAELDETNAKMAELSAKKSELAAKEERAAASAEKTASAERTVGNEAEKSSKKTGGWLDSFKAKAKSVGEKVHGLASKVKGAASVIGKFASGAKKGSGILSTFGSRLKGMALSLFVFNWITKAWNAMISAIKDGAQNVSKYSTDVNAKMSAMTSAIATLKNAFGSLGAPIISAFGPAITSFINILTAAINKINQFISALTGKSTWIKATKQTKNYAAGLGSVASGANKAAKAAKKLKGQLQSFNELNVITTNKDSSGGGGGGGGAAGGGDLFTTENIDPGISNLAEKIKDILKTDDWSELGGMLATKLNEALESIDWKKIQKGAKHIASGIATFLNGFMGTANWELVGSTIAQGLNTAITFAQTFVHTFDWSLFGRSIGESLSGILTTFDWAGLGDTLGAFVTGLFDTLSGIFYATDWQALGKGIITAIGAFFKGIKWRSVGKSISGAIHALLQFLIGAIKGIKWGEAFKYIFTAAIDFIKGFDWKTFSADLGELLGTAIKVAIDLVGSIWDLLKEAWGNVKDYFSGWIDVAGGDIIKGLLLGIINALGNIGMWIRNNIFKPFIEGFKKAFGIHSPSKEMQPLGKNIFLGMIEGIKSKIKSFSFSKLAKDIINLIKKGFEKSKKAVEIGISLIKKGWSTLKEFVGEIGDKAFKLARDGWNTVREFVGNIGEKAFKLGRDGWSTISKFVGNIGKKAFKLERDGWSTIAKFVGNIGQKKFKLGRDGWSTLTKYVGKLDEVKVKLAKKGWKSISSFVGTSVSVGISLIKKGWNSLKEFIGDKISVGVQKKADGGIYYGGMWHDIAHYALGTENAPTGQVFIAREAGPELVGTIGNHTSVLNNGQIVASVADGVYRAVKSAMGSGKQNLNVTFKVEGDPNGIFRVTQQKANEYFRATGNPAYEF